jgi:hypothetical protein
MMLLLRHDVLVIFSLCMKTSGMNVNWFFGGAGGGGGGDCDDHYIPHSVTF